VGRREPNEVFKREKRKETNARPTVESLNCGPRRVAKTSRWGKLPRFLEGAKLGSRSTGRARCLHNGHASKNERKGPTIGNQSHASFTGGRPGSEDPIADYSRRSHHAKEDRGRRPDQGREKNGTDPLWRTGFALAVGAAVRRKNLTVCLVKRRSLVRNFAEKRKANSNAGNRMIPSRPKYSNYRKR